MPDNERSSEQERADYVRQKRSMTMADKTDRERARGAEVAAANARKFAEAETARAQEEAAPADPKAPAAPAAPTMQTDFERAASGGVFPHAAEPVQPTPPPQSDPKAK